MYMPVSMPVSKSPPDRNWLECLQACICMHLHESYVYVYIYAFISMYLYVYVCMCLYVYLCRLYTSNMLISACTSTCQAVVAQWHTQPHMTVPMGVRTPTTTKAFCFRTDFLLLG